LRDHSDVDIRRHRGIWQHDGRRYEFASFYPLPDVAWAYELTALNHAGYLSILVPDATPGDGFTPLDESHTYVRWSTGVLPWPLVRRLTGVAAADMVPAAATVRGNLRHTHNRWTYGAREFDCNSFHFAEHSSWCYEIAELFTPGNDFIDVRIPDLAPESAPFVPAPVDRVRLHCHGDGTLPWLVYRRFVQLVEASGDIVGE
jgi:hypothetical protein